MSANYAKLILDLHARIVELEADNARLQKSINDCSTEEGLCYSNELQRLSDRIVQLEAALESLLAPAANGIEWHIRARELEAKLNQIVTAASYRCNESVETLEAAMAFITKTAREALAPKEKV